MTQQLEAQVIDSEHLKLKRPIQFPPGSHVIIEIVPVEEDEERRAWYRISAQGLETAFGENEPEYSLDLIKIPNQEYQP